MSAIGMSLDHCDDQDSISIYFARSKQAQRNINQSDMKHFNSPDKLSQNAGMLNLNTPRSVNNSNLPKAIPRTSHRFSERDTRLQATYQPQSRNAKQSNVMMSNSLISRLQVQTSSLANNPSRKERFHKATTPCATINLPVNSKKTKPNTSDNIKPVSKTVESCSSDSQSKSSGGKPKQNKMELMKSMNDTQDSQRS